MGNADPNEAYDEENKNLAFELREEAGKNGPARCSGQGQPKEHARAGWLQDLHWPRRHQAQRRQASVQWRSMTCVSC